MSDPMTDPIERRLRRLEAEWRGIRAAAALVVVALAAAATTAFQRHDVPALRTDRLELIDQTGRVRAPCR